MAKLPKNDRSVSPQVSEPQTAPLKPSGPVHPDEFPTTHPDRPLASRVDQLQLLVGLTGLLGLFAGIFVADRTLREMTLQTSKLQEAVTVSSRQLAITDRAWLKGDQIDFGSGGEMDPYLALIGSIAVKNVGQSVATNIRVEARVLAASMFDYNKMALSLKAKIAQDELCELGSDSLGGSLFPGEVSHHQFRLSADTREFAQDKMNRSVFSDTYGKTIVLPIVVACVVYEFESSKASHFTRLAYTLRRVPRERNVNRFLILDGSWNRDDVIFEPIPNLLTAE